MDIRLQHLRPTLLIFTMIITTLGLIALWIRALLDPLWLQPGTAVSTCVWTGCFLLVALRSLMAYPSPTLFAVYSLGAGMGGIMSCAVWQWAKRNPSLIPGHTL